MKIDLSKIWFVTTMNDDKLLSEILKNRIEIIHIPGYNSADKKNILSQYILPQMMDELQI